MSTSSQDNHRHRVDLERKIQLAQPSRYDTASEHTGYTSLNSRLSYKATVVSSTERRHTTDAVTSEEGDG